MLWLRLPYQTIKQYLNLTIFSFLLHLQIQQSAFPNNGNFRSLVLRIIKHWLAQTEWPKQTVKLPENREFDRTLAHYQPIRVTSSRNGYDLTWKKRGVASIGKPGKRGSENECFEVAPPRGLRGEGRAVLKNGRHLEYKTSPHHS